jgi:glutathione S-transferase
MKLYTYFRSSAAFRVRIALNLKGLQYESVPKHFARNEHRAADYLELNPQGLIPALGVDGVVLSQSLAIIEYLNDRHPEPPLLPADPIDRARVRSMALAIACEIHPLNNLGDRGISRTGAAGSRAQCSGSLLLRRCDLAGRCLSRAADVQRAPHEDRPHAVPDAGRDQHAPGIAARVRRGKARSTA